MSVTMTTVLEHKKKQVEEVYTQKLIKKEGRVWKERQIKQKIPVIFQCVSDGLLQFTHTVRYQEVLFWQTV